MEPRSPEQLPTPIEYTPQAPGSHETRPEVAPEQRERAVEQAGEQVRQVTQAQPDPAATPVVQLPAPVQPAADSTQAAASDDTPATAADDDLIEKEWVDKAKKVIVETKDDPYERERAVGKLQNEYLRKRYGKELGSRDAA